MTSLSALPERTRRGRSTEEALRRRTFAIISHPDAGKTTLTEKFLLYAGAVQEAGAVKARAGRRRATSDWMALEQERGISISSTVLQFPYRGCTVNLLDTPGHRDFSEDTYRVLTAADAAVMVLDVAKGIEPQTLKLFEVCHARRIPVLTFLNKCDRPGRSPLELLDEIEDQIGLVPTPVTWPVGEPGTFHGVIDRRARRRSVGFTRTGCRGGAAEAEDVSGCPTPDRKAKLRLLGCGLGAGRRGGRPSGRGRGPVGCRQLSGRAHQPFVRWVGIDEPSGVRATSSRRHHRSWPPGRPRF